MVHGKVRALWQLWGLHFLQNTFTQKTKRKIEERTLLLFLGLLLLLEKEKKRKEKKRKEKKRMDHAATKAKLVEYRGFIDNVLRPQLVEAKKAKNKVHQEMTEYRELLETLKLNNDSAAGMSRKEKRVDLGHGKVFCEAQLDFTSTIFVHVGMGFHVEFTVSEGIAFIDKRLVYLNEVLKHRQAKLRQIEEHVGSSEFIMNELSRSLVSG